MLTLNIGGIIPESVVDGPGIRFVIFAQGCHHHCPGCFNQELQSFTANKLMNVEQILDMIDHYHAQGVTFSGGDPFEQVPGFTQLAKACRNRGLSVWCYTGYTYEELISSPDKIPLLQQIDVLVDGRFMLQYKDVSLAFRGSSNQRIIAVQDSLEQGKIILVNY